MKRRYHHFLRILSVLLCCTLSMTMLTGCFAVDLARGILSKVQSILDRDDKEEAEAFMPEVSKVKPEKPEKEEKNDPADDGRSESSDDHDEPAEEPQSLSLDYVNADYLLDNSQIYLSLDGVEFSGPAFDLVNNMESYNYYVCTDDYWGYGDSGCVFEMDTSLELPDGSGIVLEEDINIYLYLDSPSIPNHDGKASMYTEDTYDMLAEEMGVAPSDIKTMQSGGTTWHYAASDDGSEYFAGSELYQGVYAYLEYDCFLDDVMIDQQVKDSLMAQFETYLSRLNLYSGDGAGGTIGEPEVLIDTGEGKLVGPRFVWDDTVIDREQDYDQTWWYISEEAYMAGYPIATDADLIMEEDRQYLAGMSDDEIAAFLAEEVIAEALQHDYDSEAIIDDVSWMYSDGIRWAVCTCVFPYAFDSRGYSNDWIMLGYGITDTGEVITAFFDIYLCDDQYIPDDVYNELFSTKLMELIEWLRMANYY